MATLTQSQLNSKIQELKSKGLDDNYINSRIQDDITKGNIEKTGGIFVKLLTSNVSIFLDNSLSRETSLLSNGALITDIAPGIHILRIEKSGHIPWSKTVVIEPSIVIELRNILLIPVPLLSSPARKEELAALPTQSATTPKSARSFTTKFGVFSIDTKENLISRNAASTTIYATQINSIALLNNRLIFIDTNGFLAEFNPETKAIATIGHPGFFLSEIPARFIESPASDIAIIDASGGLFTLMGYRTVTAVDSGIRNIYFDKDGAKALMVKEKEIRILWLKENQYQPFEKSGTIQTILAIPDPIRNAAWFFADNAHVFIHTKDGIFITEIDGRGGRTTAEVFSGSADAIATSHSLPHTLFFKQGKTWKKIEID